MRVKFTAMSQFIAAAQEWLSTHISAAPDQCRALAKLVPVLLEDYSDSSANVISISGPPGSGKSTFAGACVAALESDGIKGIVISLDDYYLPAAEREKLSRTEHPLFSVRGVPGTHDLDLLADHVRALADPEHADIELPRFDKSLDDRLEETRIIESGFIPGFIFVEGWIIGVPPQSSAALMSPVSLFEEEHDPDAEWRSRVNANLYDYHKALELELNARWYLRAPDWESVIDWRLQQEQESQQMLLENREDVMGFLDHYRRLCLHMQTSCAEWADVIIQLDSAHLPVIVDPK